MTLEELAEQHDSVIGANMALLIRRTVMFNGKPIDDLAYLYMSGDGYIRIRNEFQLDTVVYPKANNWEVVKLTTLYDIKNNLYPIEFKDDEED